MGSKLQDVKSPPIKLGAYGDTCTLWLTGLSGSGKTTLARAVIRYLTELQIRCVLLDGDEIRQDLCEDLGFDRAARDENVRRIGCIARLLNNQGVFCIAAAISPYRQARDSVRSKIPRFLEVHVDCQIDTLIKRDTKGLYRRALNGEIAGFSGISDPYEEPLDPDVYLNSSWQTEEECLSAIIYKLEILDWIPRKIPCVRVAELAAGCA